MTMRAIAVLGLLALVGVSAAHAAGLAVPEIDVGARKSVSYQCPQRVVLRVSYWNARNGQSFALVPVEGKRILMTTTVAASGAHYEGDHYVWWEAKGAASLYDTLNGPDAPPLLANCKVIGR
jgi:membrane-bound inhibitor of C-type lysozyme